MLHHCLARTTVATLALAATALLLARPGTAVAQPLPSKGVKLAILDLTTPPTMIGLGGQVQQQIQSSAAELGYKVLTPADLQAALGAEGFEQLRKCETQVSCITSRLRGVNAERVVLGSLNRDEKSYLVKLSLVEVATGNVLAEIDRNILIASRRFKQDIAEAVPRMLRGEREARGKLKVVANVKNVDVWVDGSPMGKTPVELELKPGKYEVRLEKKAYLPLRRLVTVEANQTSEEEFRLILEPGGVPEEEAVPALVATTAQEDKGGIRVTAPAWVAFGVGAAMAGAGGYFGLKAQRAERELEAGFDPATNLYSGTRAQAIQGKADARTANILYGVAAAAAVAGVLFTVFDVGGGDDPVTATPSAGPGGAGVSIEGRF